MEVIRLHYPLKQNTVLNEPVVLAMGFFDGVHRGHQQVILQAKEEARKRHLPLAVLTYDHAPGIVYQEYPGGYRYLSLLKRKINLLAQLGVDRVYLMSFTSQFAALSPQSFVDKFLIALHPQVVVAGFDHTYGHQDVANMQKLPGYARGRFDVVTVPKYTTSTGQKVGSTAIRHLLDNGQIEEANQQLGYYYITTGLVVHGLARGRTLGFPTANIEWPCHQWIPAVGVYVVQLKIADGPWIGGMVSVGYNITFGKARHKTLEINLFDFHEMIYGEAVHVRWIAKLRGEVKFNDANGLVAQLKQDQVDSEKWLAHLPVIDHQIVK